MTLIDTSTMRSSAGETGIAAIQRCLSHHQMDEALELALGLRNSYPKNIFVHALHKQLEKLADAERVHSLEADTLREGIPQLLERALETTGNVAPQSLVARGDTKSLEMQKRKAISQIKAQFLTIADAYMRKGNFENALAEVKRALTVDPSDETARGYVAKLEELVRLQSTDAVEGEKSNYPSLDGQPSITFEKPPSLDELVTMTKTDFDAVVERASLRRERQISIDPTPTQFNFRSAPAPVPAKRKSMNAFLLGSAFFIILAIGVSYVISTRMEPNAQQSQQTMTTQEVATQTSASDSSLTNTPMDSSRTARSDQP